MPNTRSSLLIMCSKESAMTVVRSMPVPLGKLISTANWLRSAVGIRRWGSRVKMNTPAKKPATPMQMVAQGWRKHQLSNTL